MDVRMHVSGQLYIEIFVVCIFCELVCTHKIKNRDMMCALCYACWHMRRAIRRHEN